MPLPKMALAEDRLNLGPQRGTIGVSVGLRRRRLRGADGIGRRETILQPGLKLGVAIGGECLARINSVLVVRRGIECLSHGVLLDWEGNAARLRWFHCSAPAC